MKDSTDWIILVVMAFVLTVLVFATGVSLGERQKEKAAIAAGHAQYNPTNANFEWKVCK